ncbi:MAG: c-type cytochrome domain-containing protein, partial [Pirellulales bacterium]
MTVASTIATADEPDVGFNADVRPIFAEHCVACHGGVKQAGGLSFAYRDNVFAGGESGQPAVVPGDLEASYLLERVTDPDPNSR